MSAGPCCSPARASGWRHRYQKGDDLRTPTITMTAPKPKGEASKKIYAATPGLLCLGQGFVMSMGWEHPTKIPGFEKFEGELVIGAGTDDYVSYSQKGSHQIVEGTLNAILELYPIFSRMRMLRQWGGIVDICPDASPILSKTSAVTSPSPRRPPVIK